MPGILTNGVSNNGTLYGTELFPGDTGLPQGQVPASQSYTLNQLRSGLAVLNNSVVTGGTIAVPTFVLPSDVTLDNGVPEFTGVPANPLGVASKFILSNGTAGATVAAQTVQLPGQAPDNTEVTLVFDLNVTTLAVTSTTNSSGGTVAVRNGAVAGVAGASQNYVLKSGSWYKA